nr:MAG TPA: hypothetical protein [Caudoviricetes sp.]
MKTYKLNRDWTMFSKGELFKKVDDGCMLYTLVSNNDILARIPDEYLDEQSHAWRPNEDGAYHYIDSDGMVCNEKYYIEGYHTDECRLAIGNCFKTAQEANDMRDWLKARQKLINSGAEFINSVGVDDEDIAYYGVAFDKIKGKLHTIKCCSIGDDVFEKRLYFLNEDVAWESIRDYRSDWLTYLGVKGSDDQD